MTTLSLFFDIAGRVTKETKVDSYFTVAGVIFSASNERRLRATLRSNLPKWRNATPESLSLVADYLSKYSQGCTVVRIEKKQPAWGKFWEKGSDEHRYLTHTLNEKVGFARPGIVLKCWAFRVCAAIGLGLHIRHYGRPELLDQYGRSMLRLQIICDSDIQGNENREIFEEHWQKWSRITWLIRGLDIKPYIDRVEFRTEEDDPILYLPDYLSGHIQFNTDPKNVTLPEHLSINDVKNFGSELSKMNTYKVVNRPLHEIYPNLVKKD